VDRDTVVTAIATVEAMSPADRQRFLCLLRETGLLVRGRRGPAASSHEVIGLRHEEKLKVVIITNRTGKSVAAVKAILRRWRRHHAT
jgi:ribonucleotide monophosphatase NagD (HAD superfamily)